jgi:hypothetical protein
LNFESDNHKLDYDLLSAIELGVDEADMRRHARLLCLPWNSCQQGYQSENEEYLRQGILNHDKSRHCLPLIEHDTGIKGADLPSLRSQVLPLDDANHSSNLFDKQHLEYMNFELLHI